MPTQRQSAVTGCIKKQGTGSARGVCQQVVAINLLGETGAGTGVRVVSLDALGRAWRQRRHFANWRDDPAAGFQKGRPHVAVIEKLHFGRLAAAVWDYAGEMTLLRRFWDAAAAGRLVVQACDDCGSVCHPPRPMCPHCGSLRRVARDASGFGTLYSYGILHHPQHPAFDYPVIAALVDLDEGVRLVTNLVDLERDDIRIGMRLVLRRFVIRNVEADVAVPLHSPEPREARLDLLLHRACLL